MSITEDISLSRDEVLKIFDELVTEGILIYEAYTTVSMSTSNGYPVEFRICPSMKSKPHTTTSTLPSHFAKAPPFGPGSDMYILDPRLTVGRPNGTHLLNLNPFPIDRPQFVLQTLDTWARQTSPLDANDFAAAMAAMKTWGDQMYLIYNCCEEAGCSRLHKHMQLLGGAAPPAFSLFTTGSSSDRSKIPFIHFAAKLPNEWGTSPEDVHTLYSSLIPKVIASLGLPAEQQTHIPHNVVLAQGWMVVIPRQSNNVHGATANAAGMMGSPWVPEATYVEKLKGVDLGVVLGAMGIPRGQRDGESVA